MSEIGVIPRLPPSRSEDTLLIQKLPPPAIRTHMRSRSSTIASSGASVSASVSPLLSTQGISGGSMHSLSSSDDTSSPACSLALKLPGGDSHDDISVVPTPAPGILQVCYTPCYVLGSFFETWPGQHDIGGYHFFISILFSRTTVLHSPHPTPPPPNHRYKGT